MDISSIRQISGKKRAEFSRIYGIPLRTLEDWESNRRKCPDYVLMLLERVVKEDYGVMEGKKMNFNTIILKKGEAILTKNEYKKFIKGNSIFGENSDSEEINRWNINNEDNAKKELLNYNCEYIKHSESWTVKEYALEYCQCDEDGDFIQGSDFELAPESD